MTAKPRLRHALAAVLLIAATAPQGARGAASESRASLEQQYQKNPNPELLYKLGVLAAEEGLAADALDFMRRYLADPQTPADGPLAKDAQKRLGELHASAGELLVSGDMGGLVQVDGRLRGVLPLTLPLLLSAGEHKVAVGGSSRPLSGAVKIEAGRRTEARFESSSRAVVVSNPPPVVVLIDAQGLPPGVGRKLGYTIDRSVTRAGLSPFLLEVAQSRVAAECRGAATRPCQEELAKRSGLDYVVSVKVAPAPPVGSGLWQVAVQLLDAQVGDTAAAQERAMDIGTVAGLKEMAELIDGVLTTGASRPRGTLSLTSTPMGAEAFVGDRRLGVTPLSRPIWTGPIDIELRLTGYQTEHRQATVTEQQKTELAVALLPRPAPTRRPAWRIGVGIGALAVGATLIGFGAAALSIDGTCLQEPLPPLGACPELFDTRTPGAALVGVGAGLTVAGVLLSAWPPRAAASRPTRAPERRAP